MKVVNITEVTPVRSHLLRSPRAAGCKSSPPLTFFKLGDPPLDRPQQAPAGRARPIVPWKGANWCAAAVGLPAAPQCQPVLRWASECVTEEVSASELWWQPSRRKSQLLSSARQRTLKSKSQLPEQPKKKYLNTSMMIAVEQIQVNPVKGIYTNTIQD